MTTRIVGAAAFPYDAGTLSATWPQVILTTSDSGISIDIRWRLLKRMLIWAFPISLDPSSVWWMTEWDDLASVDFGRRSVVLHSRKQRDCRFATLTRQQMLPLIEELERHGIVVRGVSATIGWYFKST